MDFIHSFGYNFIFLKDKHNKSYLEDLIHN